MIARNLLIEAGAGTGKTTRLVKAVIEALFWREIPLDHLVALTFTNKAAGELKERVHAAIDDILAAPDLDTLRQKPWWPSTEATASLSTLQDLARQADAVFDRAEMATIHSFAYGLLKRFPIAAGIHPNAEIDDQKIKFDDLFREEWPRWLAVELGPAAPRAALWLELLEYLPLNEIEQAAQALSDFLIPLANLPLSDERLPKAITERYERARALSADHPGKYDADQVARAVEEVLGIAASAAWPKLEQLDPSTKELLAKTPSKNKTWSEEDFRSLKSLAKVALNVVRRGDRVVALTTTLLKPFIEQFRSTLLTEGILTHQSLLFLSRNLVQKHPEIREQLKKDIRLILIDEFQDTDPLQAELLLFLAEEEGGHADQWETLRLEPGKLFIVGDPKQSIYRFRGADIAAYEQIGRRLVSQGGHQETLAHNYRSQAQIIELVNSTFERLMQPIPDVSPKYVPVQPRHPHDPLRWPLHNAELWLATSPEKQSVEAAQATEAEAIAKWIKANVGQHELPLPSIDAASSKRVLAYRDIALIFRTYSPMDQFIEALRRHGIPFAVESERFFFSTPEVTDFLNLLQLVVDPGHEIALIGFLRGPLAALPDTEILRRKQKGTLHDVAPMKWIRGLHERLQNEPLAHVLHDIFADSFLLELAARSYHGDQTLANLHKLRRWLEDFSARGERTLADLLSRLDDYFDDDTLEGESPLADESFDAVRLLTIHKAKGLEFPVVFLPSLHSGINQRHRETLSIDWRSQRLGLTLGDGFSNIDKFLLEEDFQRRDGAEQQRILYVAMTRAKHRLVLSGGVRLKSGSTDSFLKQLTGAWGIDPETVAEGDIPVGQTTMSVQRLEPAAILHTQRAEAQAPEVPPFDPQEFADLWSQRAAREQAIRQTPTVIRPSDLDQDRSVELEAPSADETPSVPSVSPRVLGSFIHKVLELWDFKDNVTPIEQRVQETAQRFFGPLGIEISEPLRQEACQRLKRFCESADFQDISQSTILGREVPFVQGEGTSLVRGSMDILYRRADGRLVVGDYKTSSPAQTPPDAYRAQGEAYQQAVQKALGVACQFRVIYIEA